MPKCVNDFGRQIQTADMFEFFVEVVEPCTAYRWFFPF